MGKKGQSPKAASPKAASPKTAKEFAVTSPSHNPFLESLNDADRRLAESVGAHDATALAVEKTKMEERRRKAIESQKNRAWENEKQKAREKENDKRTREKDREDRKWDQQLNQVKARALREGVIEAQEHMDGSWYVQVSRDTWKEVQGQYFCTHCEKHLNDTTLGSHIDGKDHLKKVAWQGPTTCPMVPPTQTMAAAAAAPPPQTAAAWPGAPPSQQTAEKWAGAAAAGVVYSPGSPLEPWQELLPDGWQMRCILCDKVIDASHLASADHVARLQALQDRQNVLQSGYPAPALPYLAYVPADPAAPAGERWMRCLLCQKWVQDEYSHSGTHMVPDGSKEHRKNLLNYPPNDPWYQEKVTREKLKYHPADAAAVPPVLQAATPAPWAACVPTPAVASWTTNAAAASTPYPTNPTVPQPAAPPELPQNWHRATDPNSGRHYYYHGETNEVRWDPPAAVNEC